MSTTDKSILEKITARVRQIIRIAEDAANHAMKPEGLHRSEQARQLTRTLPGQRRAAR